MPLVLKIDGFRLFFYSNEGEPREPIHIHVRRGGAEAKIWLDPEPVVAESYGFSAKEQNAIVGMVAAYRNEIERAWHEHFSD